MWANTVCKVRLLMKAPACLPGVCRQLGLVQTKPIIGLSRNIFQRRRYSATQKQGPPSQKEFKLEETTYTDADMDEELKTKKTGKIVTVIDPEDLQHFKKTAAARDPHYVPPAATHTLPHRIWTDEELDAIDITHKKPEGFVDKAAYNTIQFIRGSFDYVTGFNTRERTEALWIKRIIFLETVAGVPGMVAAMIRHLDSLRGMKRDYGWIHTLLEEAENERMHLMTALQIQKPSFLTRLGVICAQGVFVTGYSIAYLVAPRFCHRLVGYLEEEAVRSYTKCLQDIDNGSMAVWQTKPAPDVAIRYWQLEEDCTMRDVILAIRADEAQHRNVNHTFASMKKSQWNPFKPGE